MKNIISIIKSHYKARAEVVEQKGILFYLSGNKGYVLIIVMIICSLLIMISGEFLVNTQADISYMTRFKDDPQAKELAEIGVKLSAYILELDATDKASSFLPGLKSIKGTDSYEDLWSFDFPPIPIENGSVTFKIRDEQSKLNVSIVANEFIEKTAYFNMLQRFFQNMDLPQEIPYSILDWVDPDNNKSGYGAETNDYYGTLPVPYKAKNDQLDSIDELLMIKNITPEIFYGLGGGNAHKEHNIVDSNVFITRFDMKQMSASSNGSGSDKTEILNAKIGPEKSRALSDYLRAYGDKDFTSPLNKININTAPFRVISALTPEMTDIKVSEIIKARKIKPYSSVDELSNIITEQTYRDRISVSSQIYSIESIGKFHDRTIRIFAVYNRAAKRYYYYSVR